jgi:hypothetical protein
MFRSVISAAVRNHFGLPGQQRWLVMDIAPDMPASDLSPASPDLGVLLLPELEYLKKYRIGQKVCLLSAQRSVPIASKSSERIRLSPMVGGAAGSRVQRLR